VNSEKRTFIARLDKDGHLDDTFNPDFDNYLMNLVVQPDGKILVGGQFTEVNGEAHAHIARLQPSGELDKYFFAQANDSIVSIALQADGKMILGGYFTEVNSETHNRIVRLDAEGNVDLSLNLDANALVTAVGLQHNGTILLGGAFTEVNGEFRPKFTRFINNTSATQTLSLNPAGDQITWSLGNASPQVYRVTYELSTNGILYTDLGDATYIGGKWQLDNLTLPEEQDISIRARGYYSAGRFNGSGSILEQEIKTRLENLAPTDISLSNNAIEENQPVNTVVGAFSTTDPNIGDTFTYTLVSGPGASHNNLFNISGNNLQTSFVFDYEAVNSYSIRVRSTDQDGLWFESAFTIHVLDVDDEKSLIYLPLVLK
jgi:uncharacterized delta-60 repeat protein